MDKFLQEIFVTKKIGSIWFIKPYQKQPTNTEETKIVEEN